MNVDVLNRSGVQAAGPVEARHRRLRRASAPARRRHRRGEQGAVPVSVAALARPCRDHRRALSPALGAGIGLSQGPAAGLSPRRLAERRQSRQRPRLHGRSSISIPNNVAFGILNPLTSGQGAQDLDLSAALTHATNEWQVAEWTSRDSRLKASVVVPFEDGPASAKMIEARAGDPQLRPGAAADPHRRTARPAALLADLSGGGGGQSAGRHPCVRLWRQRDDLRRLAVLLHRGDGRPRAVPAGGADQPDLRRRVRALPDAEGGAGRSRLRLGAGACLADGPAVRQAAARRCRT